MAERADVIIIGGGVIGLAAARALAVRGARVKIIERNAQVGMEASHAAGGMLTPQSEADAADEFFRLCDASREMYPQFARELFEETGVSIELDETGTLYLAFNESEEAELIRRYEWQSRAGMAIERLTAREALALEPNLNENVRFALRFPRDWQVEPRRLCEALEISSRKRGVEIEIETEVSSLLFEDEKLCGVETSRGSFYAERILLAAGAWSSLIVGAPREVVRVEPVRGQMLCFAAPDDFLRHVVYTARGYLIPRRGGRLLAGTTTEQVGFDKRVTEEGEELIRKHAMEIAPRIETLKLIDRWAGLRPHGAFDGAESPLIGRASDAGGELPDNLFFAVGHYRNGILLAPVTADALAEIIIENRLPSVAAAFSPARVRRGVAAISN